MFIFIPDLCECKEKTVLITQFVVIHRHVPRRSRIPKCDGVHSKRLQFQQHDNCVCVYVLMIAAESGVSSGSPSDVSHSAEDSDPEVPANHHHHTLPHLHHTAVHHHHKERASLKRVVSEPAAGSCPPPPPPPLPANDFHRQVYVHYVQQQSARNQSEYQKEKKNRKTAFYNNYTV